MCKKIKFKNVYLFQTSKSPYFHGFGYFHDSIKDNQQPSSSIFNKCILEYCVDFSILPIFLLECFIVSSSSKCLQDNALEQNYPKTCHQLTSPTRLDRITLFV